ncbi:MAG: hypothetical protein WCP55_13620, partial [Lentisphaerota bacterium]
KIGRPSIVHTVNFISKKTARGERIGGQKVFAEHVVEKLRMDFLFASITTNAQKQGLRPGKIAGFVLNVVETRLFQPDGCVKNA